MVPSAALNLTDCRILRIRGYVDGRRRARSALSFHSFFPLLSKDTRTSWGKSAFFEPSAHGRHTPTLRLTRQRADRPFLSLFSLFSAASDCYAPEARACSCVGVCTEPWCAYVHAPIGGHNSRLDQSEWLIHFLLSSFKAVHSLALPCYCPRAHPLYLWCDFAASPNPVPLTCIRQLRIFPKLHKATLKLIFPDTIRYIGDRSFRKTTSFTLYSRKRKLRPFLQFLFFFFRSPLMFNRKRLRHYYVKFDQKDWTKPNIWWYFCLVEWRINKTKVPTSYTWEM